MFYKKFRGRGEIGRRAALRMLWRNPWGFDSPRPHHPLSFTLQRYDPKEIK